MPIVSVEMMPVEFAVVECQGGVFIADDVVTLTGPHGALEGNIGILKHKTYGVNQEPGLAMTIAITQGNLKKFANPRSFDGYMVTKKGTAVTGKIRKPCLVSYRTQLMDRRELQTMLDTGLELIRRAATFKKSDYVAQWFGAASFESSERDLIHRRCGILRDKCEGLANVIFQCAAGEALGAISTTDPLRNGATARIQLGRGFTYSRYSKGERVCTMVHELTHWFLNTVDAKLADGTVCYGLDCIRLAKSPLKTERAKALNNADNWAYYICEYRTPSDGGDWSNFTEEEIKSRGPFVSNGYGAVPEVMAFYA